jgi:photosystem II PsbT protein
MEALVYTFLLIGTLIVIFFAVFFRESPRIIKKIKPLIWFYFFNPHVLQMDHANFLPLVQKLYKQNMW